MSRTLITFEEPDSFYRRISLLSVDCFNEILPLPERSDRHFTMLVAMDGLADTHADVCNVSNDLLEAGLVYLCTWGADCAHVDDIFSHAAKLLNIRMQEEYNFRSTYHESESLDDALWFFLNAAIPDDSYAQSCRSAYVVSVGHREWENHLLLSLSDIRGFNRRILNSEGAGS
jgi:hypothetical protein